MKSIIKAMLILAIALLIPIQILFADECDDLSAQAKNSLESAREAHGEKYYGLAGELYEEAAEYYDMIEGMKDDCRCPILTREAQSRADKYHEKANECDEWTEKWNLEVALHKEYNRAAAICREGHTCARKKNYEDAIDLFEEAAEIWDDIGTETESQYSEKAISAAKETREAADYARKYLEE